MSPAKFNGDLDHQDSRSGEINGQRPSPLKINKGSHLIHKASSTSSMSISSSVSCVAPMPRQQQRQPVIIYTHSPKIIHTQARDFMALVQKLTGVSSSRSDYGIDVNKTTQPPPYREGNEPNAKPVSHDDNESTTSALTDENSSGGADFKASLTSNNMSSIQNQTNQYFADMPLFTPNTTNFFCSPRPVLRYPDSAYVSPKFANSMSPSVFEFMKELPEY
ncbi:hypothetical protein I3843_15G078400 [Carya illinoinensis]|nr:hypothetical protein I3843_15G078400 [Carya illinoinensis]